MLLLRSSLISTRASNFFSFPPLGFHAPTPPVPLVLLLVLLATGHHSSHLTVRHWSLCFPSLCTVGHRVSPSELGFLLCTLPATVLPPPMHHRLPFSPRAPPAAEFPPSPSFLSLVGYIYLDLIFHNFLTLFNLVLI